MFYFITYVYFRAELSLLQAKKFIHSKLRFFGHHLDRVCLILWSQKLIRYFSIYHQKSKQLLMSKGSVSILYRICSSKAPLLNTTSPLFKSPVFGGFFNRTPFFSKKVHFLRDYLNWTSPKNPYWKIKPRGYNWADMVIDTY